MASITVEVAVGEVADKISILRIKSSRLRDSAQLMNVRAELETLERAWHDTVQASDAMTSLCDQLAEVNESLWEIEDEIRRHEAAGDFGASFVELARSVYITNDRRASLKRSINELSGSRLMEEKSYEQY